MSLLDYERLEALDASAFRRREPYPWINPPALLTEAGYRRLLDTLPDPSLFDASMGVPRSHGQRPHDRLVLEYHEGLPVASVWHAFVAELRGARYLHFLRRMLGHSSVRLNFHWHYTPQGASVSPHCDARRKLGSHIFYFNTEKDWNPEWGGQTLILGKGGRLRTRSAPEFERFRLVIPAEAIGNRSLLFQRGRASWHGMHELRCPETALRKVFIVVANRARRPWAWSRVGRRSAGAPVRERGTPL